MKTFFQNDSNMSMGRLLCFSLFIVIIGIAILKAFQAGDIGPNWANLIKWGLAIAIAGKGAQGVAESLPSIAKQFNKKDK